MKYILILLTFLNFSNAVTLDHTQDNIIFLDGLVGLICAVILFLAINFDGLK